MGFAKDLLSFRRPRVNLHEKSTCMREKATKLSLREKAAGIKCLHGTEECRDRTDEKKRRLPNLFVSESQENCFLEGL